MIYRLRKKFIKICTLSFIGVFLVLFFSIYLSTSWQTASSLDTLADIVSDNDGSFPDYHELEAGGNPNAMPSGVILESPFTTRFFTVRFLASGQLSSVDIRSVASVTREEAVQYATAVLQGEQERGWMGDFRYKRYNTEKGTAVVFVNGANMKEANQNFLFAASAVFIGGSLVVLLLVVLVSKRAVKPAAESYEKQRQFITDANHELKTPLTLIRTNLDIMESEIGANEWLSDIREETGMMAELVNRLVTLARMDEKQTKPDVRPFNLSEALNEMVSAFSSAIESQRKELQVHIPPSVIYTGDEAAVRQMVSILMDNAVKYCDAKGVICVTLHEGKHPVLTFDNTYAAVGKIELNRLFDRFYRADKARLYGDGFGIGLSIAKAIAEKQHGTITAWKIGEDAIRFQVKL